MTIIEIFTVCHARWCPLIYTTCHILLTCLLYTISEKQLIYYTVCILYLCQYIIIFFIYGNVYNNITVFYYLNKRTALGNCVLKTVLLSKE